MKKIFRPSKINLLQAPTPVHKLDNLSKKYGYELYIKRDDLTGLALGGNKTRKLEYLLADAIENHAKAIVTEGAIQSNHARQTAVAAKKLGLEVHLILYGHEPQVYNANLLIDAMAGAKIHLTSKEKIYETRLKVMGMLKDCHGSSPYFIPIGGSNSTGLWGYIDAIAELKQQMQQTDTEFDYIVVATSSGGTLGGIIAGKKMYNLKSEILGIEISKNIYPTKTVENHITTILKDFLNEYDISFNFDSNDIYVIKDYDEAGYAVLTDAEKKAIYEFLQNEGIILDPVYTGRAAAGLIELMKKNFFRKNSKILFWHTGGTPALFAYADELYQKPQPGKDNLNIFNENE